jgi:hypothetical protein
MRSEVKIAILVFCNFLVIGFGFGDLQISCNKKTKILVFGYGFEYQF